MNQQNQIRIRPPRKWRQTPKPSKKPAIRWLTYLLLLPLVALATAGFGCVSLICGLWDKSGRQQHAIARMWARVLLLLSLSPVELVGAEKLHLHGVAVYASNHLSYYDTPVLFAKLPFQFRILAKQSLWKIPFIGWYLNRSGQVPVDQSGARAAIASLSRGVTTLKSGMPLVIFPEGGRAADLTAGRIRTFLSGGAFMAIKAQVPLVPLTLVGTYELLPIHTYHLMPRPLNRRRRPHLHHRPDDPRRRHPHPAALRHHHPHLYGASQSLVTASNIEFEP